MIHIVKEGLLLVSPRIFQKYIEDYNLAETVEDIEKQPSETKEKRAFKLVQKKLEKSKLNIKAKNKMNIHMYKINGQNKTSKIRGFLVPSSLIYDGEPPAINPVLENITGILAPATDKLS